MEINNAFTFLCDFFYSLCLPITEHKIEQSSDAYTHSGRLMKKIINYRPKCVLTFTFVGYQKMFK